MDPRLLRWGDVLAFAAGVGLLVALALEWSPGQSGWAGLPVLRVFLALVALSGIALGIAGTLKGAVALPLAAASFATPLGLLATLILVIRIPFMVDDGMGAGAWLGLACSAAVFWGAFRSMKDEGTRTPRAREQTERVLAIRGAPRPAPPAERPPGGAS